MVQPRRQPGDTANGTGKRDSASMSGQRKDGTDGRMAGNRTDGKAHNNGSRSAFRTDTAISSSRMGGERVLKPWVPGDAGDLDGSLEATTSIGGWDQFAENERRFGTKSDYHENYYTTAIDTSHPQYSERLAAAEKTAREIQKSAPTTAHVAEERLMDYAGGEEQGGDEEDKYSGVRRQKDFPPLSAPRDNKYTPPARRAPTGHSTVTGAPVDPAIISAQIKWGAGQGNKKQGPVKADEFKASTPSANRSAVATPLPTVKTPEPKADAKALDNKAAASKPVDSKPAAVKQANQAPSSAGGSSSTGASTPAASSSSSAAKPAAVSVTATPVSGLGISAVVGRSLSPNSKATISVPITTGQVQPSATENVEGALLKEFKTFATQQRLQVRHNKIKAETQVKLQELKKFATTFKLSTPVPNDLIPIIAKDPAKQKQIQEKAKQNAEEIAMAKEPKIKAATSSTPTASTVAPVPATTTAQTPARSTTSASITTITPGASTARRPSTSATPGSAPSGTGGNATDKPTPGNNRSAGPVHNNHNPSPANMRHPNNRSSYAPGYRQQTQSAYRGDRAGGQHMAQGGHTTGNLADRIRNGDQNRYAKPMPPHAQHHFNAGDIRPPTGPANGGDPNYARRVNPIPTGPHMGSGPKLNPTTHEFRPSPFAQAFNPTGPSAGSSPRSTLNNASADMSYLPTPGSTSHTMVSATSPRQNVGSLIRRKTKAVDSKKCHILAYVKTIIPPEGRDWDANNGMRPSYDTQPVWRAVKDEESSDSTMNLTYKQYFERLAFSSTAALATPIQSQALPHVMPQMAHQHQLPMHMQPHNAHMGPRPASHMPPMAMHAGGIPHGHVPHASFNGADDHRMMQSNSAQSYASPRLQQVPMYPQGATPQMAYAQPIMAPFMPANQMNQYRSFSNNPQQYMQPQGGPVPMMPPQQFVTVPAGMMPPGQQMPMYPGTHPFMAPPGVGTPAPNGGVAPPQPMNGSNGYPSPSRPAAAPMMAQQGSQQGQPMYGMSPTIQYQQPAFAPPHPGQGGPIRGGYNNSAQQFGTSPQQMHQYGPPHRNGGGNYGGKNYQNHGHNSHHGPPSHQGGHAAPVASAHHSRPGGNGSEEAK